MTLSTRISAGKLRTIVQILQPTNSQDSTGGSSLASYTIFASVWGSITPLNGAETLAAQSDVSVVRQATPKRTRPHTDKLRPDTSPHGSTP